LPLLFLQKKKSSSSGSDTRCYTISDFFFLIDNNWYEIGASVRFCDALFLQSAASVEPATQELGTAGAGEWSGDAIRQRFLEFYAARGHKILPSSSLVPDDHQFKPIFLDKVRLSYCVH